MRLFKNLNKDKLLYGGLILTFVILYGATAFVSWYHSITFFNIANAVWLSVLLSFVAEVGQASVLFSILLTENKNKFLPWFIMIILTALQVIGNVVSSYQWIIDHNGAGVDSFQKSILFWIETGDPQMFKVIIAWISGSLLPIIALSMTALVAQNMKLRSQENKSVINEQPTSEHMVGMVSEQPISEQPVDANILISEISKIRPNEEELNKLEYILSQKKTIADKKDIGLDNKTNEQINDVVNSLNETPALSDEEIMEMNQNEYDRTNYLPENDESIVEENIVPKIDVISNDDIPVEDKKEISGTEEFHNEMEQIRNEMIEEDNQIITQSSDDFVSLQNKIGKIVEEINKPKEVDTQPVVPEAIPPIVEPQKEQQMIKKKSPKH